MNAAEEDPRIDALMRKLAAEIHRGVDRADFWDRWGFHGRAGRILEETGRVVDMADGLLELSRVKR